MKAISLKSVLIILAIVFANNLSSQNNAIFNGGVGDGSTFATLGSEGNEVPLPIILVSFSFDCHENQTSLSWATSSEMNNDYFTIERSEDGINWLVIGKMNGAGNSNSIQNYTFEIPAMFYSSAYYRLMQTDYNGKFEYFNPIYGQVCSEVNSEKPSLSVSASNQFVEIFFTGNQNLVSSIEMFSITGKRICSLNSFSSLIDIKNQPNGSYIVVLKTENEVFSKKFILL